MKNHLILGDWNALCDSCGRKFKASSLQKRWDGLIVCREDWEQRHPQDLLRVQREQISVPWSRPYPATDTFIPIYYTDNENEYLGLVELIAKGFTKVIGSGANNNTLNSVPLNFNTLNYGSVGDEAIGFTEVFLVSLARFLTDNLSLAETVAKTFTKTIAETLPVAESLYFAETEAAIDTLSLSETTNRSVTKQLSETVSIAETLAKLITPSLSDALTITETYVNAPNKKPTDTLSIAETSSFTLNKVISESLSITESYNAAIPVPAYLNGSALNLTSLG